MKKRIVLITGVVMFTLGLLPACDFIEECGTCELVTEDANGDVTYGTPLPFCGDQLQEKKDQSPVTVGGITTYWNCY